MPRCNASQYVLCIRVPSALEGVVDLKDHVGDDARAVLDVLVSKGCRMEVDEAGEGEGGGGQEAVWDGQRFRFYNFLANTGDISDSLKVDPNEVVKAIDRGGLTGAKSPNGFYRLVVMDDKARRIDAQSIKELVSLKSPKKYRGRGLKKIMAEAIGRGLIPSSFGVDEIKKGLLSMNWKAGVHYSEKSIVSAVDDLTSEGLVTLDRDGMVKDRVWGVTSGQISKAVAPGVQSVGGQLDEMVERLADMVASRVEQRAKEKLGL